MCEEAIKIASDYMQKINLEYQASVLKILYAYAEKSKATHTKSGGGN